MNAVVDLVGGETLRRSYVVVKKGGVLATIVQPIDESAAKRARIRAIQHEVILRPKTLVSCWPTTLPNLVKNGLPTTRSEHHSTPVSVIAGTPKLTCSPQSAIAASL
jgi:hypothetical protein